MEIDEISQNLVLDLLLLREDEDPYVGQRLFGLVKVKLVQLNKELDRLEDICVWFWTQQYLDAFDNFIYEIADLLFLKMVEFSFLCGFNPLLDQLHLCHQFFQTIFIISLIDFPLQSLLLFVEGFELKLTNFDFPLKLD